LCGLVVVHGDSMDQWLVPIHKFLLLKNNRNLFPTVLAAHVFESGILFTHDTVKLALNS